MKWRTFSCGDVDLDRPKNSRALGLDWVLGRPDLDPHPNQYVVSRAVRWFGIPSRCCGCVHWHCCAQELSTPPWSLVRFPWIRAASLTQEIHPNPILFKLRPGSSSGLHSSNPIPARDCFSVGPDRHRRTKMYAISCSDNIFRCGLIF